MKGYCEKCIQEREVKRLELGGGAGIYICKECFDLEMDYRNKMKKKYKDNFVILTWEELKEVKW